ncbi:MAG: flagellar basal body rod protein FlgC [Calditrichia bacterium]
MPFDKIFNALNISSSGLSAQRQKLDVIAANIANAETTRTEDGGPYQRKKVVMKAQESEGFQSIFRRTSQKLVKSNPHHISSGNFSRRLSSGGAEVKAVIEMDPTGFRQIYDPSHPDADENGYVYLPNVNLLSEMVDMISASRGYEANLTAIDAAKKMAKAALDI